MRLLAEEQKQIKAIIHARDKKASIYLYGSRVNKNLKGGDIDLLVISETLTLKDKIDLLIEIKEKLGDQKIDLSIKSMAQVKADIFYSEILRNGVRL